MGREWQSDPPTNAWRVRFCDFHSQEDKVFTSLSWVRGSSQIITLRADISPTLFWVTSCLQKVVRNDNFLLLSDVFGCQRQVEGCSGIHVVKVHDKTRCEERKTARVLGLVIDLHSQRRQWVHLSPVVALKSQQKCFNLMWHEWVVHISQLWFLCFVAEKAVMGISAMSGVLTTLGLLFKHGKREDLVHCGRRDGSPSHCNFRFACRAENLRAKQTLREFFVAFCSCSSSGFQDCIQHGIAVVSKHCAQETRN